MKWLIMVQTVLKLLPAIIDAIKAIEDAIPGSGNGVAKLAAVRGIIEAAYSAASDAVIQFQDLWPSIEKTIAIMVDLFNSLGIFKKG